MSPTRFRCANSLGERREASISAALPVAIYDKRMRTHKKLEDPGIDPGSQPCEGCMLPCTTIPLSASFGTRTRTYTLEGCNSTLKLRMRAFYQTLARVVLLEL